MKADVLAQTVVLSIKSAVAPLLARFAAVEARIEPLGDVRDRLAILETKASAAPVVAVSAEDHAALRDRVLALEAHLAQKATADDLGTVRKSLDDVGGLVGTLRERVAVVETRQPIPGPAGAPGKDGRDGADGTGWDGLVVEHDGERTFTVKSLRGERVRDHGTFTVPALIYRGVYAEGKTYQPGDTVTWGGAAWVCRKETVLKPDTATSRDAWQLAVKSGRDGKDGKDAPGAAPVVSLK